MIAIAAATGTVGRALTYELVASGESVRVLTRDAARAEQFGGAVEVAVVDHDDPASLERALAGVDRAFIATGVGPRQPADEAALIDAAMRTGVRYAVKLSVLGAGADYPVVVQQWNTEAERALRDSGLAATILRPATYFTAVAIATAPFREAAVWGGATDGGRAAFIDPADVGVYAARLLADRTTERAPGEVDVVDLTGPESLSMADVRDRLRAATGAEVEYETRTVDEQRGFLEGMGMPPLRVDVLLGVDRMTRDGIMATVSPAFEQLVGRAPIALGEWLRTRVGAAA